MNQFDRMEVRKQEIINESVFSEEFFDFWQKNMKPFETMLAYYRCAIMEIETKFKVLNEQFSLQYDRNPIETIKTRLKSTESLIKKIHKRNIPLTVEDIEANITDIAGVRVVCSFPEDIYLLADCLLQQDDITLIKQKDYIENPKHSGYRSLHLIVEVPIFLQNEKRCMKVEVQLRTIAMDFWASVEHKLRYKKHIPESEAELLAAELVECAEISASLDFKMQDIRRRLAQAELEHAPEHDPQMHLSDVLPEKFPVLNNLEVNLQKLQERNVKWYELLKQLEHIKAEKENGESV